MSPLLAQIFIVPRKYGSLTDTTQISITSSPDEDQKINQVKYDQVYICTIEVNIRPCLPKDKAKRSLPVYQLSLSFYTSRSINCISLDHLASHFIFSQPLTKWIRKPFRIWQTAYLWISLGIFALCLILFFANFTS